MSGGALQDYGAIQRWDNGEVSVGRGVFLRVFEQQFEEMRQLVDLHGQWGFGLWVVEGGRPRHGRGLCQGSELLGSLRCLAGCLGEGSGGWVLRIWIFFCGIGSR